MQPEYTAVMAVLGEYAFKLRAAEQTIEALKKALEDKAQVPSEDADSEPDRPS